LRFLDVEKIIFSAPIQHAVGKFDKDAVAQKSATFIIWMTKATGYNVPNYLLAGL